MYGLIAKIKTVPGKRDEMIVLLKESAANMPGYFSYVVSKDAADEITIWVTEVWDTLASHDASLSLPQVKQAVPRSNTRRGLRKNCGNPTGLGRRIAHRDRALICQN
jgi:quinol monooxygenase YgiN